MGFLRKFFRKYIWLPLFVSYILKKMPVIRALGALETVTYLHNNDCSCVRFGDGEFAILTRKGNPGFQKASDQLREKMELVLRTQQKNLLVCITGVNNCMNLSIYNDRAKYHFRNVVEMFHQYFSEILVDNALYGDCQFTRPYMDTLNRDYSKKIFQGIKNLLKGKKLIIIEGDKTRLGVGNDLLLGAESIKRVLAPSVNAFDKYDQILQKALEIASIEKDTSTDSVKGILFLLALGPTAKPLVLDLTNAGYRAIDIGHLDIEYEWYLRGAKKKIPIPGKYVNEAKDGKEWSENPEFDFEQYNREVVARI